MTPEKWGKSPDSEPGHTCAMHYCKRTTWTTYCHQCSWARVAAGFFFCTRLRYIARLRRKRSRVYLDAHVIKDLANIVLAYL
jgi:hypothetical protein